MNPLLLNKLQTNYNLSPQELKKLSSYIIEKFAKKGEILLEPYQIETSLRFVIKGIIKSYTIIGFGTEKEKQAVKWLSGEGHFATSFSSFFNKTISLEYVEAATDCQYYEMNMTDLEKILVEMPSLNQLKIKLLEQELIRNDRKFEIMASTNAMDKYVLYQKYYTYICGKINGQDEASFLGFSRDTLQEIKRNLQVLKK